jgi:hypothetical protein
VVKNTSGDTIAARYELQYIAKQVRNKLEDIVKAVGEIDDLLSDIDTVCSEKLVRRSPNYVRANAAKAKQAAGVVTVIAPRARKRLRPALNGAELNL